MAMGGVRARVTASAPRQLPVNVPEGPEFPGEARRGDFSGVRPAGDRRSGYSPDQRT